LKYQLGGSYLSALASGEFNFLLSAMANNKNIFVLFVL